MATFNHHGRILPEAETLLDRAIIRKFIRGVREDLSIRPGAAGGRICFSWFLLTPGALLYPYGVSGGQQIQAAFYPHPSQFIKDREEKYGPCGSFAEWPAQYPSVVIAVEDMKASIGKVTTAGGQVLGEPMEIPGVGLYVSFEDTEGNRVSMLQPLPRNDKSGKTA
jgi:hypothetical protein